MPGLVLARSQSRDARESVRAEEHLDQNVSPKEVSQSHDPRESVRAAAPSSRVGEFAEESQSRDPRESVRARSRASRSRHRTPSLNPVMPGRAFAPTEHTVGLARSAGLVSIIVLLRDISVMPGRAFAPWEYIERVMEAVNQSQSRDARESVRAHVAEAQSKVARSFVSIP